MRHLSKPKFQSKRDCHTLKARETLHGMRFLNCERKFYLRKLIPPADLLAYAGSGHFCTAVRNFRILLIQQLLIQQVGSACFDGNLCKKLVSLQNTTSDFITHCTVQILFYLIMWSIIKYFVKNRTSSMQNLFSRKSFFQSSVKMMDV